MSRSGLKKDTVPIRFEQKDRAHAVLRTLIRNQFFGEALPSDHDLVRQLRLPRTAVSLALQQLIVEKILAPGKDENHLMLGPEAVVNRSGRIGFVTNTGLMDGWYSLFLDFLIGVDEIMDGENYGIHLLTRFGSLEEKQAALTRAWADGVMGFVFLSYVEEPILDWAVSHEVPVVLLGNAVIQEDRVGVVASDNSGGIQKLVEHLATLGHERVAAYICGLRYHQGFALRQSSFLQAAQRFDLRPVVDLCYLQDHHGQLARQAAVTFQAMRHRPTAILCGSDREAFELIAELKRLQIRVPEDVSVTGFDNNHYAGILEPTLTTVDIFGHYMGRVAANYLLNEMEGPQMPVKILLPTELVVRQSTQAIGESHSALLKRPATSELRAF